MYYANKFPEIKLALLFSNYFTLPEDWVIYVIRFSQLQKKRTKKTPSRGSNCCPLMLQRHSLVQFLVKVVWSNASKACFILSEKLFLALLNFIRYDHFCDIMTHMSSF